MDISLNNIKALFIKNTINKIIKNYKYKLYQAVIVYNIVKNMNIENYSFGKITIDGRQYKSDVIIYPDKVDSSWWRKEGHKLQIADLTEVVNSRPEVLIIGTGYSGVMIVPEETISYLKSKGIKVYIERTTKAVELFNKLQKDRKVVAALHLTC